MQPEPLGLLERAPEMAVLQEALERVLRQSTGQIIVISGEAGIGKSTLVRAFCEQSSAKVRVLRGACDALFTPRALGPFLDVGDEAR
jgi:predicted ATPase